MEGEQQTKKSSPKVKLGDRMYCAFSKKQSETGICLGLDIEIVSRHLQPRGVVYVRWMSRLVSAVSTPVSAWTSVSVCVSGSPLYPRESGSHVTR